MRTRPDLKTQALKMSEEKLRPVVSIRLMTLEQGLRLTPNKALKVYKIGSYVIRTSKTISFSPLGFTERLITDLIDRRAGDSMSSFQIFLRSPQFFHG